MKEHKPTNEQIEPESAMCLSSKKQKWMDKKSLVFQFEKNGIENCSKKETMSSAKVHA